MLLPWELEGDLPLSLPFRFLRFPERPARGVCDSEEACLVLCPATQGEGRPGLQCEAGAP